MTWLSSVRHRLAEWFAAAPAPVSARLVSGWARARGLSQVHDYRTFAEDGYRRNAIIYACIREIATSAAEPALQAGRVVDGQFAPLDSGHQLAQLLATPNPEQSTYEFVEAGVTDYLIAGNAFLYLRASASGKPAEMWWLKPNRIKIVPSADLLSVSHYLYGADVDRPQEIPAADVLHFRQPDPLDDWWGLSPIAVLARFGDLDNQATDFLRAFFQHGAAPQTVLKFKKIAMTPGQRQAIGREWDESHSGSAGWHRTAVADEDVDVISLGATPDKLRLDAVFGETEARICAVFGVPPILVGAWIGLMRSTFANYAEARRSFWQETLAPLYRRFGDKLTSGLAPRFGPGLRIRFDLSTVEALQEDRAAREERAIGGWNAGLYTRDEARARAGLPPAAFDGDGTKAPGAPPPALAFRRERRSLLRPRERHAWGLDGVLFEPGDRLVKELRAELERTLAAHGRDSLVEIGIAADFDPEDDDVQRGLDRATAKAVAKTFNDHARELKTSLLPEDLSDEELGAFLRDFFTDRANSIDTGARTQVTGVANLGRVSAYEQAGLEEAEWVSSRDEHVRDSHAAVDGEVRGLRERYSNGLLYPGDPAGSAEETINCVLPGTLVEGRIVGALKAFYAGEAVELTTAAGYRVAVTVNHPVLTPDGVRAAGTLGEGDYVVCQRRDRNRGRALRHRQHEDVPARVEDVFEALAAYGTARVHRPSTLDLDGDGEFLRGHVHQVVLPGSLAGATSWVRNLSLRDESESSSDELAEEFALVVADVAAAAPGLLPAASRGPRFGELASDRGGVVAHRAPLKGLRLGLASRLDFSLYEALPDGAPVDGEVVRELVLAGAGQVTLDKIVHVQRREFSGHVYDLSTEVGYFASGNVLSRNCRCDLLAIVPGAQARSRADIDALWWTFAAKLDSDEKRVAKVLREMLAEQERRVRAAVRG